MGPTPPLSPVCEAPSQQSRPPIPSVVKAGSAPSPAILSPSTEFPLPVETSGDDILGFGLPPSTANPVPANSAPGVIPLFSPSEEQGRIPPTYSAVDPDAIVFADAIPAHISYSTSPTPASKKSHNLRLPSFDMLGIAAPRPGDARSPGGWPRVFDPFQEPTPPSGENNYAVGGMDVSVEQPAATKTGPNGCQTNPETRPNLPLDLPSPASSAILTPPTENNTFISKLPSHLKSAEGNTSSPAFSSHQQRHDSIDSTGLTFPPGMSSDTPPEGTNVDDEPVWLQTLSLAIVSSLDVSSISATSIRVLSHALPTPSVPGHHFPAMIDALRKQIPPFQIVWINLLHAVPGRFNIADLPSSPPTTPGFPSGGDDYFTTKIFDSAVPATDYDSGATPTRVHPLPVAAPSSVNLSIVERYIPPTSINEFSDLFNPTGSSLLVDRLTELSPQTGCLVFIYPTRKGAKTFTSEYLGPALDPLLRGMSVLHGYSSDLSQALGQMVSVDRLYEFETMELRTKWLCQQLSGSSGTLQRLHGVESNFTVTYSGRHDVALDPAIWSSWWVRQEKMRIRRIVSDYFASHRLANHNPHQPEVVPRSIIHDILEGVSTRAKTFTDNAKIEVGIFVIRRNA